MPSQKNMKYFLLYLKRKTNVSANNCRHNDDRKRKSNNKVFDLNFIFRNKNYWNDKECNYT